MKIAISLPDELSEAADDLAQRLGMPRSRLFAMAVAEYLAKHRDDEITQRLNEVYAEVRAVDRASDAEMKELGATVPIKETALRDMQRAWIAFRDATCAYEYSHWGGGTGGGPAYSACFLEMTARQTLVLQSRLDDWQ